MKKTMLNINIISNGGIITPENLQNLLNSINVSNFDRVIIVSGRMPLWAAAAICHKLHPAAAVALYEPRSNAGIVVQSHTTEFTVGDVISIDNVDEEISVEF